MSTKAKIKRLIDAAVEAAREQGVVEIEVKIGDGTSVRMPLAPDKPLADSRPNSFDQVLGGQD